MKPLLLFLLLMHPLSFVVGQLYFPPAGSAVWETTDPENLDWCSDRIDSLYNILERNNTRAFILLKDGKIVLEKYFNGHTQTSNWYWASAGKSLTAVLVGLAYQEGHLSLSDKTSKYLGPGWTSCTSAQEDLITIRHQLTMTTGLDDTVADPYCTDPGCLVYKADSGTRWAYHNGPYTLLDPVMENATGQTLNSFNNQRLKLKTGMDGLFIKQDYNNIFFSTARSMARFGLFILNKGNWNGNQIVSDTSYFRDMVNTSQDLNKSYGYLWWLNGKSSYMIPQTQFVFPGSMNPHAPDDMFAAMGKNGQFVNVVPSQSMVWIRMGDAPDESPVPFLFNNLIWQYINKLPCNTSEVTQADHKNQILKINPNPVNDRLYANTDTSMAGTIFYTITDLAGRQMMAGTTAGPQLCIQISGLPPGTYFLTVTNDGHLQSATFVKQ